MKYNNKRLGLTAFTEGSISVMVGGKFAVLFRLASRSVTCIPRNKTKVQHHGLVLGRKRERIHILFVLLTMLLVACDTNPPPAPPTIDTFKASGPPELISSTEPVKVWDCPDGRNYYQPSKSVTTSESVHWEVGGEKGVGMQVGVGSNVVSGSIDLSGSLSNIIGSTIGQTREYKGERTLQAQPNSVAHFTVRWTEVWQPGYVEVHWPSGITQSITVKYLYNIQSDVDQLPSEKCGASESASPTITSLVIPTATQPESYLGPICTGNSEPSSGVAVNLYASKVYVLFHYPAGIGLGVPSLQFVTGVEVGSSNAKLNNFNGTIIAFDEGCAGRIPASELGVYTGPAHVHAEYRVDGQGRFLYPGSYQNKIPPTSRLQIIGGPLNNVPLP